MIMINSYFVRNVLNEVQYSFPISETPFIEISTKLGISIKELIMTLKMLKSSKVIKRIGFYYNYRSQGEKAALVALNVKDNNKLKEVAKYINKDPEVTHNYLRLHKDYNIWFTIRRRSIDQIVEFVEELSRKFKVERWLILPSKRVFKLSVKYDLLLGISRSGPFSHVPEHVPNVEDLGIPHDLPNELRSLSVKERPYLSIARKYGVSEDEIIYYINLMLKKGVLLDPGASLDGHAVGFNENAMMILTSRSRLEELCGCLTNMPYTTHVVLREVLASESAFEGVKEACYGVIHAVKKALIEDIIYDIKNSCEPDDLEVAYSIKNLKPTVR